MTTRNISLEFDRLLKNSQCSIRHGWGKRLFDLLFSAAILLLFSPFLLLIACLIKITSKGPLFHKQERVGRGGRLYTNYKFRTMHKDAELILVELLEKNPLLKQEWRTYWKLKKDPRITPIGAFLRKTSLDEFPQFWNVLKGDLSVVGPRPVVRQEVVDYYGPKAAKILSVRPGITGLWQVSGRNHLSMEKRVELEVTYVDKSSFWFDLLLICKTIPAILSPKGAF